VRTQHSKIIKQLHYITGVSQEKIKRILRLYFDYINRKVLENDTLVLPYGRFVKKFRTVRGYNYIHKEFRTVKTYRIFYFPPRRYRKEYREKSRSQD